MLIFSRKVHEKVNVTLEDGRRIEIVVVDSRRGKARIGITAPATVRVDRDEVTTARERGEAKAAVA